MNYGHNISTYNEATVEADLLAIRALGINIIRVVMPGYQETANIATAKQIALKAKSMGFYVKFGVGTGVSNFNATQWANFLAALPPLAEWAAANGIDEFIGGNEELHKNNTASVADSKVIADLKSQFLVLRRIVGAKMILSYSETQNDILTFVNHPDTVNGTVTWLDYINFNVYGDDPSFDSALLRIKTRLTNARVTEWGLSEGINSVNGNEVEFYNQMARRYALVQDSVSQADAFVWRGSGYGIDERWSFAPGGTPRLTSKILSR